MLQMIVRVLARIATCVCQGLWTGPFFLVSRVQALESMPSSRWGYLLCCRSSLLMTLWRLLQREYVGSFYTQTHIHTYIYTYTHTYTHTHTHTHTPPSGQRVIAYRPKNLKIYMAPVLLPHSESSSVWQPQGQRSRNAPGPVCSPTHGFTNGVSSRSLMSGRSSGSRWKQAARNCRPSSSSPGGSLGLRVGMEKNQMKERSEKGRRKKENYIDEQTNKQTNKQIARKIVNK